jgi:hypothetical protein
MPLKHPFRTGALALGVVLLGAAAAAAEPPQRFQCDTTLKFGPGPCPGNIPAMHDNAKVEIDLERKIWKSDHIVGPIEVAGDVVTLKKWGAGMEGRDATLDRGSGAFYYHHEAGCLVETQAGSCQSVAEAPPPPATAAPAPPPQ